MWPSCDDASPSALRAQVIASALSRLAEAARDPAAVAGMVRAATSTMSADCCSRKSRWVPLAVVAAAIVTLFAIEALAPPQRAAEAPQDAAANSSSHASR